MKDIIIDAGRRLGEYFNNELGGRVTPANAKKLCAVATDILPGERYEAVRNMLTFGARYGILEDLATEGESERIKINNAIYTLTTRALMADGFARMAVALLLVTVSPTASEVERAERLIEGGLVSELFSAEAAVKAETQVDVQIPPEFKVENGVLVRYLGEDETVNVPRGITEIGDRAFGKKSKIRSVNLPEGITAIGAYSFAGCLNLARVSLPDSLESIGAYAFYDCRRLEAVGLPRGLTVIGAYAFYECNKLKVVDIPRGVTRLPTGVFCRSGIAEIVLPQTLESIGDSAFFGTRLKAVSLPDGLSEMGERAFSSCCSLKTVSVPGSLSAIPSSAFALCLSLKEINIGVGVKELGERALSGCVSLKSVDLPSSVKYIGAYAFENDHALAEIRLNGRVASCSAYAYSGCFARIIQN